MSSETGIPEFLAGTISSIVVGWLLIPVVSIQTFVLSEGYRSTVNVSSTEYASLTISSASATLTILAFTVISVYFYSVVAEKLYYWWKARRGNK